MHREPEKGNLRRALWIYGAFACADFLILAAGIGAVFGLFSDRAFLSIGAAALVFLLLGLWFERTATGANLGWIAQVAPAAGALAALVGWSVLNLHSIFVGCLIAFAIVIALANIALAYISLRDFLAASDQWQGGER